MHKSPIWFNLLAHSSSLVMAGYFIFLTLTDPSQMALHLSKDHVGGGGLVERLTVIILIPGILAGLYAFIKYRNQMTPPWTAYWLLLWTLACFYFAGEEISWGQWFFEWETPQSISQLNDQNETNFHNMSTWFDQKPRTLVELWVFAAGLLLPLFRLFRQKNTSDNWKNWIVPVNSLVSAALFFTIVRLAGWSETEAFRDYLGSSELRELCIALFLSLFLISYPARLSKRN